MLVCVTSLITGDKLVLQIAVWDILLNGNPWPYASAVPGLYSAFTMLHI